MTLQRQRLAQASADRLREIVLACEPGTHLGSLGEVARRLGVGIVTVQQAARILEHEGLLVVKRGPGGGYYGARPDEAALERSLAAYLRVRGADHREALEMMSLFEVELVGGAARCGDEAMKAEIADLETRVDGCDTAEARIAFEDAFNQLLFRMIDRPLTEFLSRVTRRHYATQPLPALFPGEEGVAAWKDGRRRTLRAILAGDEALARFEADRHRAHMLAGLDAAHPHPGAAR